MKKRFLIKFSIWRYFFWEDFSRIFSLLGIILYVSSCFVTYRINGAWDLLGKILSDVKLAASFIITALIWLLISAIRAFFALSSNKIGSWNRNRFTYREPIQIFKTVIRPEDHEERIKFSIRGIPVGVNAGLKIECDGGICSVGLLSNIYTRSFSGSLVVSKNRCGILLLNCPSNSDPTTVTVNIVYLEEM